MSANRLTVACCMFAVGRLRRRRGCASRPHDHCTVPAPNTSAPLAGPVQREVVGDGVAGATLLP